MSGRFLLLLAGAILSSCSALGSIKLVVEQSAQSINGDFVAMRQAHDGMVREIEAVYATAEQLDYGTDFLASEAGGAFQVFGNNLYYHKTLRSGACYYYSLGGNAPSSAALRELRIMVAAEAAFAKAWQSRPDLISTVFYGVDQPTDLAAMYPWFDVVSILPTGIRLSTFEWFKRSRGAGGPSLWSGEPFVDLASGWVMDVAGAVDRGTGDKGATVVSINLGKLHDKYLAKATGNLVLLSQLGVVVSVSPNAGALLGVAGLNADALAKSRENKFASADYRLGATGQTALAQALAQALAKALAEGKSEGTVSVDGKTRAWLVVAIPEVNFRLVGFTD